VCRLLTYLYVSAYLVNETIIHPNLFENVQTFSLLANVTSDSDVFRAEKQSM
jgi:hypothetical protein